MWVFYTHGITDVVHSGTGDAVPALVCMLAAAVFWYGFIKLATKKSASQR